MAVGTNEFHFLDLQQLVMARRPSRRVSSIQDFMEDVTKLREIGIGKPHMGSLQKRRGTYLSNYSEIRSQAFLSKER